MKLYVAYGSNMDMEQMQRRCPTAKFIDTAIIKDYRLSFKHSQSGAYATIDPAKAHYVPATLFLIRKYDENRLDYYEGFRISITKKH